MWLLLACSGVGFALIVERVLFWFLERRQINLEELENFFESIHEGNHEQAKSTARSAETQLLRELLEAWNRGGVRSLIEAYDLAINRIEERSHRYLYGIKTIVSVSPLLGILGTVLGIIYSFDVMGASGAAANPEAIGAGLAQALTTTAFGLMIAVPGLIAHNYFKARARKYVGKLDEYADELAFHLEVENGTRSEEPSNGAPVPTTSSDEEESVT
jgi:biopolymer transport protein ExbB